MFHGADGAAYPGEAYPEGAYPGEALARYAPEAAKATPADRSPFERDRARVLHSFALRRLAGKTQVVGPHEDDFPRTRLTHSLECAQIGRELAHRLGADPDLVDAACLAHDLGHPPFGHNGEVALDRAAASCGGFEGNAQSLRELTRLEVKILGADGASAGLNLTRATLDAATKYPWRRRAGTPKFGVYADDLPVFEWLRAGAPADRRCLEASLMDWADDVAFSVHDLEDGVNAGLVDLAKLDDPGERRALVELTAAIYGPADPTALTEALDRLRAQPWWVRGRVSEVPGLAALKGMTSELTARFTVAAVRATRAAYGPGPLRRYAAEAVIPAGTVAECAVLKAVTARFVMTRVGAAGRQAHEREVIAELVELVTLRAPDALDPVLRAAWERASDEADRLRVVIDQVARFTDTSALRRHAELVSA